MQTVKLGSHVGMAGKDMFLASVKEAESYGANVLMLYTGAPQNTRRKEISELNIEAGWAYAKTAGITELIVHAPYIINLANTVKPETYRLAVEFLAKEIERTAAMRSRVLVLHPGSHVNAGVEAGLAQIIKGLNTVLDADDHDVYIALETMAGKGSELGKTFEEIRAIYDGVHKKERLRVCFDTCHVNDAGYDLVHDYEGVLAQFDEIIGLDQIAVIHVNDSKNPLGTHKDRHENIGRGSIGFDTLYRIVHDERFADVPKILETPWLCEEGSTKKTIPPYREEIARLRKPVVEKDVLFYVQPVVYAQDGQIAFVETISRWRHPEMGILNPGKFVEKMIGSGTIDRLDFFMFEQACRTLQRWQELGMPIGISVNFTRLTLTAENFKGRFREIAERYAFDHSRLIVEITEVVPEKDKTAARKNVQFCHDLGFSIALDDIGSGNTFFSDLKDYSPDLVKLDQSLLADDGTGENKKLFQALVHMCQELGVDPLCEGAENEDQVLLARESGCKYIQGFYYYNPMAAEEFEEIYTHERGIHRSDTACMTK